MNIMYKYIYLNFGLISFINKEMVTFIQLHTYKFGLVYLGELSDVSQNVNSFQMILKIHTIIVL